MFYETLDGSTLFKGTVAKEDRSKMNACIVVQDEKTEKEFSSLCEREVMIGVKGHRTVGGFRISMYNALPLESVKAMTDLMRYFAIHKS